MATVNTIITCRCDNPVEHYCKTCRENLCSNCKTKHLQSETTNDHSVVEYADKLLPGNAPDPLCNDHNEQECIYWCDTCGNAACVDCPTSTHRGHTLSKLYTILKEKKHAIQIHLKELETNAKERRDLIEESRQKTNDYLDQMRGMEKKMIDRAKQFHWEVDCILDISKTQRRGSRGKPAEKELIDKATYFHRQIDEILRCSKKEMEEMKASNLVTLYQRRKNISDGLDQVKKEIEMCERTLRDGDTEGLLFFTVQSDRKNEILPIISPVLSPILTPSSIDTESLTKMFQQLHIPQMSQETAEKQNTTPLPISSSVDTDSLREMFGDIVMPKPRPPSAGDDGMPMLSIYRGTDVATDVLQKQLIPRPSIQSTFHHRFSDASIACVAPGQAWLKKSFNCIELVDTHGYVMDSIHTEFNFQGMTLSQRGEILLAGFKCIRSISHEKKMTTLFDTRWAPYGVCSLRNEDIVVTFPHDGRVIIFNISGRIVKELDKELFALPQRVAQNKVNGDLYITNSEVGRFSGPCKVLAFDSSFEHRFEYTGTSDSKMQFHNCAVCTDDFGRVLIANGSSCNVHILDKDGHFLQSLLTTKQGRYGIDCIDVDSDGTAWVKENNLDGKVKIVKYMQ